ncbi:uncharacterized protein LOC143204753 isoform X3 [Rhynchophorus ferrugineus]|uniref:uncharacterized protein LOC143204753 isoform X3 n=1 Tax=Rhynchophorus ferrugineus TaxID=354439 RepID=UPI003FCCA682
MIYWIIYPEMEHNEGCECYRCVCMPQKPYEDCGCHELKAVEKYNPCIYHQYYQTPCSYCKRTHYQQNTSVYGYLPVEYDLGKMSSHYTSQISMTAGGKSGQIHSPAYQSVSTTRRVSLTPGSNRQASKRNGLDAFDNNEPIVKSFGLQTCKETGVGDCPACLTTKNNCHAATCQLCCEPKTCGPNFKNCPFGKSAGVQTDSLCNLDLCCPCACADHCGGPCTGINKCDFTGLECRCTDKGCNTSKHCIIVQDDDEINALWKEPSNKNYSPDAYETDDDYYEQTDVYVQNTALDPEDIIRRCHTLCQTSKDSDLIDEGAQCEYSIHSQTSYHSIGSGKPKKKNASTMKGTMLPVDAQSHVSEMASVFCNEVMEDDNKDEDPPEPNYQIEIEEIPTPLGNSNKISIISLPKADK